MTALEIILLLLKLTGALVLFLYGMKLMSEGLQKIAGKGMRHLMAKITNNPFSGILVGTLLTFMVQSSSASTVMIVSFVNAGMLNLSGAIAMIMGANIGSTLITWILKIFALGGTGDTFQLPIFLLAFAIFFMFSSRDKLKYIGEFVIGFALLLLGMDFLQAAVPNLEDYPQFLAALGTISDHGYLSVLLFTVIGIVLTCIVQASAAMMAIALAMCFKGYIGFEVAMALVMGLNIGTTITANIAATVANSVGKKAARAHLVFNVIGTIIMLIAFRPVMILVDNVTTAATGSSPYTTPDSPLYDPQTLPWALCFFHTFFNVVNTIILVWFIPLLIRIVDWMVKPKKEDAEDEYRLTFIGGSWMNTAELNIQSAKQEIGNFSKRVLRMYAFLPELDKTKGKEFDEILKRTEKYEGITDRMEIEIAQFLTKVSEGDLSNESSQRISSMLRIVDNLESIGDSIYQMAILKKNQREQGIVLDQECRNNLDAMYQLVGKSLEVMDFNLHQPYDKIDLTEAYAVEKQINKLRDKLRNHHLESIKAGAYTYQVGTTYSGMYALYEKTGDYVINVSEALRLDQSQKVVEHNMAPQK